MSRTTSKEKRKKDSCFIFLFEKINDQYLKIKVSDSKVIIIRFVQFIFILFFMFLNVWMNEFIRFQSEHSSMSRRSYSKFIFI